MNLLLIEIPHNNNSTVVIMSMMINLFAPIANTIYDIENKFRDTAIYRVPNFKASSTKTKCNSIVVWLKKTTSLPKL